MNLILVGFGNLGQGFARALLRKEVFLKSTYNLSPKIVGVADEYGAAFNKNGLDIKKLLEVVREKGTVGEYPREGEIGISATEVIRNIGADTVFELTPTNIEDGEPGLTHIKEAMIAGRNVITANKGPLVVSFRKLEELAFDSNVKFMYSAAVGGAIPIIGLAKKQLTGDEIHSIRGVLNGTTNYILTRISEEGVPFDVVLKEAQELGIAERDPSLDIKGVDTACKITVLANALLRLDAKLEDVDIIGIERIGAEVMRLAKDTNSTIKLIGTADPELLEVAPKLVPMDHPLAVGGMLNAVMLKTDLAREISVTGFGAGPQETSSALLNDLIDCHIR